MTANGSEQNSTSCDEAKVNISLKNLALFNSNEEQESSQSTTDKEEISPRATVAMPPIGQRFVSPWQNTSRASAVSSSTRKTKASNQFLPAIYENNRNKTATFQVWQ